MIDVLDDKGKLKYVQSEPTTEMAVASMKEHDNVIANNTDDLAAKAFEYSAIFTQAYIDIYNRLIEAQISMDNATAATSTIFIQVFQKLK